MSSSRSEPRTRSSTRGCAIRSCCWSPASCSRRSARFGWREAWSVPSARSTKARAASAPGDLDQQIVVRTGDELEALADQFNRMTTQLRESYAGLERKVDERTTELTEALEQQKASAEVLEVISSSISDAQPVFDKILQSCQRLFDGHIVGVGLVGEDGMIHLAGSLGADDPERYRRDFPVAAGSSIRARARRSWSAASCIFRRDDSDVPVGVKRGRDAIGFSLDPVRPALAGRPGARRVVGRARDAARPLATSRSAC